MELTDLKQIRQLLEKYDFNFSKALGQNFLINPSVCPKMAEICTANNVEGVIEIGPGIGVLTKELSKKAKKVIAIELDRRLFPILGETLADCPNVEIIQGDVLKLDLKALIKEHFGDMKVAVCANLPYYITSPIIMGLLEAGLSLDNITVMVQKEAAERLCALPGSRECGAVSAAVRFYCVPEIMFQVGRGSFTPPPKVDSAVINLKLCDKPPVEISDTALFFKCVKAAFAQRRKTVVNSVSATLKLDKALLSDALEERGISPLCRAEQLDMPSLAVLCDAVGSVLAK